MATHIVPFCFSVLRWPFDDCNAVHTLYSGVSCHCTAVANRAPASTKMLNTYRCTVGTQRHIIDKYSAVLCHCNAVASRALAWTKTLVNNYSCNIFHPSDLTDGQNIAAAYGSFGDRQSFVYGFNLWLGEAKLWTYSPFTPPAAGCSTGNWADCGHYTQVGCTPW